MKVKLAAQVLSRRMGLALRALKSDDLAETIIFVETFNKWFDLMNVRSLAEGYRTLNEDVKPFTSSDDCRLKWLEEDFIQYLDNWAKEVAERPGDYSKTERSKMLLSKETVEGLKITGTLTSLFKCHLPFFTFFIGNIFYYFFDINRNMIFFYHNILCLLS
jgi:hypothetical protein